MVEQEKKQFKGLELEPVSLKAGKVRVWRFDHMLLGWLMIVKMTHAVNHHEAKKIFFSTQRNNKCSTPIVHFVKHNSFHKLETKKRF